MPRRVLDPAGSCVACPHSDMTCPHDQSLKVVLDELIAAGYEAHLDDIDARYARSRLVHCTNFQAEDDSVEETELTPQARPNVLFEAGMAMGLSRSRTVLVQFGKSRQFSDIGGVHVVRFKDNSEKRQVIAQRLQSAGCEVSITGTDWHTAGSFPANF